MSQSAEFGSSVSVDGDTLAVGAHLDDVITTQTGSVIFYEIDALDVISLKDKVTYVNRRGYMGSTVAVDGENSVVGSHGVDSKKGIFYFYERELD